MSDLFEIKGINVSLKVKDREYKFHDPAFLDKINLQKINSKVQKDYVDGKISREDYLVSLYECNKKLIKIYLPDIEDDILDALGEFSMTALINKISELTQDSFGAVVEKVEKK